MFHRSHDSAIFPAGAQLVAEPAPRTGIASPGDWLPRYRAAFLRDPNVADPFLTMWPLTLPDGRPVPNVPSQVLARGAWCARLIKVLWSVDPDSGHHGLGGVVTRSFAVSRTVGNPYAVYPTPHLGALGLDLGSYTGRPSPKTVELVKWIIQEDSFLRDPAYAALMGCYLWGDPDAPTPVHYLQSYTNADGSPRPHSHLNFFGDIYVPPEKPGDQWSKIPLSGSTPATATYPGSADGLDVQKAGKRRWSYISPKYIQKNRPMSEGIILARH